MVRKIKITVQDIPGLRRRLEDPRPVLKSIGALMTATSQDAFKKQAYAGERWPERYEGRSDPFINVAGALSDLNRGSPIKSRRFERRPAAVDTREMFNKISFELVGQNAVQSGSTALHAPAQVFGLAVRQTVTAAARNKLTEETRRFKKRGGQKFAAIKKLGFLHVVDELTTQIQARPHIGIYPELEREIVEMVEDFVAEG